MTYELCQDEWWTPVNIVGESEVHEDEVVMKGLEGSDKRGENENSDVTEGHKQLVLRTKVTEAANTHHAHTSPHTSSWLVVPSPNHQINRTTFAEQPIYDNDFSNLQVSNPLRHR